MGPFTSRAPTRQELLSQPTMSTGNRPHPTHQTPRTGVGSCVSHGTDEISLVCKMLCAVLPQVTPNSPASPQHEERRLSQLLGEGEQGFPRGLRTGMGFRA
jgi:hypothetical protein